MIKHCDAPAVTTWRWTADSFERAGEAGVFGDAHADLIDGEVHVMSPQSPLHAYILDVLTSAVASCPPSSSPVSGRLSAWPTTPNPNQASLSLPAHANGMAAVGTQGLKRSSSSSRYRSRV